MDLLPPLLSIVVLAALASGANLLLHNRLKICPVCAGVFGTWLWMLVAHLFGVPVNVTVAALLLGGSVVGITTKLESRFPENRAKVVWKLFAILLGIRRAGGRRRRGRGLWVDDFPVCPSRLRTDCLCRPHVDIPPPTVRRPHGHLGGAAAGPGTKNETLLLILCVNIISPNPHPPRLQTNPKRTATGIAFFRRERIIGFGL